jgi:hypothetical protein
MSQPYSSAPYGEGYEAFTYAANGLLPSLLPQEEMTAAASSHQQHRGRKGKAPSSQDESAASWVITGDRAFDGK